MLERTGDHDKGLLSAEALTTRFTQIVTLLINYCVPLRKLRGGTKVELRVPSTREGAVRMLQNGHAQGFHVDYFFKGHGPTDFDRWARETPQESEAGAKLLTPSFPRNPLFATLCNEFTE